MIRSYGEDIFSQSNVELTRKFVSSLLGNIREKLKIKDEEDFLWLPKKGGFTVSYRDNLDLSKKKLDDDVSVFKLDFRTLYGREHENSEKIIWVLRQSDGFSCAGASVFTSTCGYIKIDPVVVWETCNYVTKNNPWSVEGEPTYGDLLVEGLGRLVYTTSGIVPTILFGKIAHKTEDGIVTEMEEEDNMFNDEERFVKLMRIVRFASICVKYNNHWFSLVCVPVGPKTADSVFVLCDSFDHESVRTFPSYRSLYSYFFVPKTRPTSGNPILHNFPIALAFYPLLQTQDPNGVLDAFMKKVLEVTIFSMETKRVPFVDWKVISDMIDDFDFSDYVIPMNSPKEQRK